jgi:hypothetical protein
MFGECGRKTSPTGGEQGSDGAFGIRRVRKRRDEMGDHPMKKIISLTALVLALGAMPLLSHAEGGCTSDAGQALACVDVTIDQDAQTGSLDVDGDAGNPDPLDGYVHVEGDADGVDCYASDEGSFDTDEDPGTCEEAVTSNLP